MLAPIYKLKEIQSITVALRDEHFDEDGRRWTDKTRVAPGCNSRQHLAVRQFNLIEQVFEIDAGTDRQD